MNPPTKPYVLPDSPEGEYYPRPLLSLTMVRLYNEDKVSWDAVKPYTKTLVALPLPQLPRQIVQVCSDFHHASSYIALCNDGTVWYGTHKVVHDKDGEYKPSPTYWVRLPDIPQGEPDENRLDELEGRDRPTP